MKRTEKQDVRDGVIYKFSSDWIYQLESENHFRLYWNQLRLMENEISLSDKLLEVGKGSGFVANYLHAKGYSITTLDIDSEKKPDIVANIIDFIPDKSYDALLAFEVFEHIPFKQFEQTMSNLLPSIQKYLFISIPHCERELFHLSLYLPKIGTKQIKLTIPKKKISEPHHFWEIGYQDISLEKVFQVISQRGFHYKKGWKVFHRSFLAFSKKT